MPVTVFLACLEDSGQGPEIALALHQHRIGGEVALDLVHRAIEHRAALVDEHDTMAHGLDLEHQVGGHDDGLAPLGLLGEHLDSHAGIDRVQVGERLIDYDQVGLVYEGGDQLGLLLHAAAQVLDLLLAIAPEIQAFEPLLQPVGSFRLGQPLERGEIFQRRRQLLIAIEAALLGHVADPAFLVLGHGTTEKPDLAAVRGGRCRASCGSWSSCPRR